MQLFEDYIYESKSKDLGGLTIFDIDDTLFHTTAKIAVMKDGKQIRELTNQEFNTYKLKAGESFDFRQFRSAAKFRAESKPIDRMLSKAKIILRNAQANPKSRVIILTARDDFDDKKTFLATFRDHGLDIDKIRVERAGKMGTKYSPAIQKAIIIYNYLKTEQFGRVRLFDDSMANLKEFLKLKQHFPKITFEAYFAMSNGTVKTIKEEQEFVSKAGAGEWGRPELLKNYLKDTPGQPVAMMKKWNKKKHK
jgi:hypothetical protein